MKCQVLAVQSLTWVSVRELVVQECTVNQVSDTGSPDPLVFKTRLINQPFVLLSRKTNVQLVDDIYRQDYIHSVQYLFK